MKLPLECVLFHKIYKPPTSLAEKKLEIRVRGDIVHRNNLPRKHMLIFFYCTVGDRSGRISVEIALKATLRDALETMSNEIMNRLMRQANQNQPGSRAVQPDEGIASYKITIPNTNDVRREVLTFKTTLKKTKQTNKHVNASQRDREPLEDPIDPQTWLNKRCYEAFKSLTQLMFRDKPYKIRHLENPIESVTLPNEPRFGYPLTPAVKYRKDFPTHTLAVSWSYDLRVFWFVSKSPSPVAGSAISWHQDENCVKVRGCELLCESLVFTPIEAELNNKYLVMVLSDSRRFNDAILYYTKHKRLLLKEVEEARPYNELVARCKRMDIQEERPALKRVLLYNLLVDTYLYNCENDPEYPKKPEQTPLRKRRYAELLRELLDYEADIIILHEVPLDLAEEFLPPQLAQRNYWFTTPYKMSLKYCLIEEKIYSTVEQKNPHFEHTVVFAMRRGFKLIMRFNNLVGDLMCKEENEDLRKAIQRSEELRKKIFTSPTQIEVLMLSMKSVPASLKSLSEVVVFDEEDDKVVICCSVNMPREEPQHVKILLMIVILRSLETLLKRSRIEHPKAHFRLLLSTALYSTPQDRIFSFMRTGMITRDDPVWRENPLMKGIETKLKPLECLSGCPPLEPKKEQSEKATATCLCTDFLWGQGFLKVGSQKSCHIKQVKPLYAPPPPHIPIVEHIKMNSLRKDKKPKTKNKNSDDKP